MQKTRFDRDSCREFAPGCAKNGSPLVPVFLSFFPAEPGGWAHSQRIGWGTGNTGSSGITGSSGSFLRRGIRGKALANSPFFARSLPVLLVFPVLPELGLKSVPGRAGGRSALANDLLGRTDENGQKRFRTVNTPGCPKNGSPLISVFLR